MKVFLYIVPNLSEVSGGPRSRITNFKSEFHKRKYGVIEGSFINKLFLSLKLTSNMNVYVESSSNRISFADLVCLLLIRLKTENVIVFIRDIYIEILPEEYKGFRKQLTRRANKFSTWFYTKISAQLVFPTKDMGEHFYRLNPTYKHLPYEALPPGCANISINRTQNTISEKIGICYMGGVNYPNSGITNFLNFASLYPSEFNFYILSQDCNVKQLLVQNNLDNVITTTSVPYSELNNYFRSNNILFGFHARERSLYDDITFPIKILDYISLEIPFLTDLHQPLLDLMGQNYLLFAKITDYEKIAGLINKYSDFNRYKGLVTLLKSIKQRNLYSARVDMLEHMFI